jgi:hypothetical protein
MQLISHYTALLAGIGVLFIFAQMTYKEVQKIKDGKHED